MSFGRIFQYNLTSGGTLWIIRSAPYSQRNPHAHSDRQRRRALVFYYVRAIDFDKLLINAQRIDVRVAPLKRESDAIHHRIPPPPPCPANIVLVMMPKSWAWGCGCCYAVLSLSGLLFRFYWLQWVPSLLPLNPSIVVTCYLMKRRDAVAVGLTVDICWWQIVCQLGLFFTLWNTEMRCFGVHFHPSVFIFGLPQFGCAKVLIFCQHPNRVNNNVWFYSCFFFFYYFLVAMCGKDLCKFTYNFDLFVFYVSISTLWQVNSSYWTLLLTFIFEWRYEMETSSWSKRMPKKSQINRTRFKEGNDFKSTVSPQFEKNLCLISNFKNLFRNITIYWENTLKL